MAPLAVRRRRRRGAFGLDDRRRPDPARTEAEIRAFIGERLPEVWLLPVLVEANGSGRTLVLLLARGHAAVLRVEREPEAPGPAGRAVLDRCVARHIPSATVSTLDEARAALRRLGIEPRPTPVVIPLARIFRRCREKRDP